MTCPRRIVNQRGKSALMSEPNGRQLRGRARGQLCSAPKIVADSLGGEVHSEVGEGKSDSGHADEEASAAVCRVLVEHVVQCAAGGWRVSVRCRQRRRERCSDEYRR
jgi:hypothetical protein